MYCTDCRGHGEIVSADGGKTWRAMTSEEAAARRAPSEAECIAAIDAARADLKEHFASTTTLSLVETIRKMAWSWRAIQNGHYSDCALGSKNEPCGVCVARAREYLDSVAASAIK